MDPFIFVWATEEPPPARAWRGGKPLAQALDSNSRFGLFTKPKKGTRSKRAKRKAKP
jgi:hypothetical protein